MRNELKQQIKRGRKAGFIYSAFRRFRKNKLSIIGGIIFLSMVIDAVFCPYISPYDPNSAFWGDESSPPSQKFLLGTDRIGRDVLSRVMWGARTSLMVGIISTILISIIGVSVGSIAGYKGGILDNVLMRITDMVISIPTTILLISIVAVLRTRSLGLIMVVIGLVNWPTMARIARSEFLSIKERPYVEAARSIGASDIRIILRYILPNATGPIIVTATINMAYAILWEAALSFLGLGDPTAISWGTMLMRGYMTLRFSWWEATFPGLAIFITVLGINFLGDGLRDAFDVRMQV